MPSHPVHPTKWTAVASHGRQLRMVPRPVLLLLALAMGLAGPGSTHAPLSSYAASDSPMASAAAAPEEWPQLGRDPQRTNYSPQQVDPPYCYTWKWYEAPMASRAQPVVSGGRLFMGSMDGKLYARDASTGAPLWSFASGGPIRHSAAVSGSTVLFGSHDGFTYALNVADGSLRWKTYTGPTATAPLIDEGRGWAFIGSTNGKLTALNSTNGQLVWEVDTGAPILTSPSLSLDGQTVYVGNEAIDAIALHATDGSQQWIRTLQGQSLADRYPVAAGDAVIYRSQPLFSFHLLLHEGDDVMDQAGAVDPDWSADWSKVGPEIVSYLSGGPAKQTFFVLNSDDGSLRGVAPVLYTYGSNNPPNVPVIRDGIAYLTYRARHGIQTDGGATHVTSRYDAELGRMDLTTLDIVGLRQANYPAYQREFRMTSDEPAMLTLGGDILWVDNWERLGGLNVRTGQLIHVGAVSNDWPECHAQCGPGTPNPVFPLSGSPSDPAYPFPSPRVGEGSQRGGLVIANGMLYWRVIEGGLVGISHRVGSACPAPQVWTGSGDAPPSSGGETAPAAGRPLADYVTLDLTLPVADPPADLVDRLREEVRGIATAGDHLMPFYLERGFSQPFLWPYNVTPGKEGLPAVTYGSSGNVYWHDPGELLYSMALAYPYLDPQLQADLTRYMADEMQRYPPLKDLARTPWLTTGVPRERYQVPFRESLNSWPPPAANISALYALWLWSRNTGDWSYAQSHWDDATALFEARQGSLRYYADIAGVIGYARMAQHLGQTDAYSRALQVAVNAMETGKDFASFRQTAEAEYLDPFDRPTGWYVPVFYGMTPEVGLYLREQAGGEAERYLASREEGNGLRWWYLTRVGVHAEEGETSYVAPIAAWSHFLAHAYVVGESQATLRNWLDRPWGRGDLYSIQKLVATIHAEAATPPALTFADVPPTHPQYREIEALYRAGYTAGCATDPLRYCPDQTMNRAESAVFVERGIHGVDGLPPQPSTQTFADLRLDSWAAKWAEALWQDHYTAGCGTDPLLYCPWQGHTRAEGCVFYLRMLNGADYMPEQPTTQTFADVALEAWYAKWVQAGYDAGLLPSCGEDPLRFCPDGPLTRAWAAYMMVQAKGLELR